MKNRQKHPLPFLVTLAGCVLMLAWVDPVNATEVTRQLTQQGYSISQLRKSDVSAVQSSHSNLKVIFKGFAAQNANTPTVSSFSIGFNLSVYHSVFPNVVKSILQADIRTWRKRE
jgi:hypothetical protein